ncbi:MAG TPA: ATP-binding protein [Terriglobales bacterium]|jgi:signal transduction histidine kinase
MRRKTQIVLAIAFMVAALVTTYSYIYISQLLRQRIEEVDNTASNLSSQLAYLATSAVPDLSSTRVDTNNPEAVRRAIIYYLSTDRNLNTMMQSVLSSWPMIYETSIVDSKGRAILDTDPSRNGQIVPERADFRTLRSSRIRKQFRMIYSPATTYDVVVQLQLNGAPFGTIHVGISTVFIRNEITLRLQHALVFSGIAILFSLFFAAGLSHIALGPLEHISRTLDSVAGGVDTGKNESGDEYGLVTLKIANIGQQMRDAKEIFSALKDNVDQIMGNLQDGLLLFTRDSRIVLVSASVERFLGRPRQELLGRTAKEVFSRNSALGILVLEAFHLRSNLIPQETESPNGKRIELSLDFIQEKGSPIGALMTLRDAESVRRIEDEIELSRRMSASGRLTRGVAHEVKNPINAIVLHLQLLQNKLQQIDPDTRRHMEIIDSEIHRLDRVVQILVDFTRQRDLHLEDIDLRRVLEDVALLAAPDAEQHGVMITRDLVAEPLPVKIDVDFMKQAILNVVLNGIQAMPQGGNLSLRARKEDEFVLMEIQDQGGGIPGELQGKIFELYFTTKESGTGIGLAQTYQILQWHYGSVDFESIQGKGTTFRLRIPLAELRAENLREETSEV